MKEDAVSLFVLGLLSFFVLKAAKRRHFFQLPSIPWEVPLRFVQVCAAFAIYLSVSYCISSLAIHVYHEYKTTFNPLLLISAANFTSASLTFLFLFALWKRFPAPLQQSFLRRPTEKGTSLLPDIRTGFWGWIISYPFVLFIGQLLETLVYLLFHVKQIPDQVAVQLLKATLANPISFIATVFTIIILAPLVEETLFRGFLQTWIRRHLGSKTAIGLTSACFSLFHYAAEQGLGNIPIIGSLFLLSLFLGFLYEKQGSLLAPMTLHASFNTFNVLSLYLSGGS